MSAADAARQKAKERDAEMKKRLASLVSNTKSDDDANSNGRCCAKRLLDDEEKISHRKTRLKRAKPSIRPSQRPNPSKNVE